MTDPLALLRCMKEVFREPPRRPKNRSETHLFEN